MRKSWEDHAERLSQLAIRRQIRRLFSLTGDARSRSTPWVTESATEEVLANLFASAESKLGPLRDRWNLMLSDSLLDFKARWTSPSGLHPLVYDSAKNRWASDYQGQIVPLRRDQIQSAIRWGNGFVAGMEAYPLLKRLSEEDLLETTRDARDIAHIWLRFSPDGAKLNDRDIRWHQSDPFERLVTDILNEPHFIAKRASRDEDFFELTDIRVKYPDLGRRRGARLQVTLIQSQTRLSEKLERIRQPEELIILSSHSLSAFMGKKLSPADIQSHFRFAMAHPAQHPAGPSQLLPTEFRQSVRDFVKSEALRSTHALRQRESKGH